MRVALRTLQELVLSLIDCDLISQLVGLCSMMFLLVG